MAKATVEKLMKAIEEANELYNSLVLLIGPAGIDREAILNEISNDLAQQPINLNLELSKQLLEMTDKKRTLKTADKLDEIIAPFQKYAILDYTDILFDVSLKQDPLVLLKRISRNRTVIASWNGSCENGKLTYAAPGHQEYRIYDANDIQIVKMDNDI